MTFSHPDFTDIEVEAFVRGYLDRLLPEVTPSIPKMQFGNRKEPLEQIFQEEST